MNTLCRRRQPEPLTRRQLLQRCGAGFGALALADLLQRDATASGQDAGSSPSGPHFEPRAKRVIFVYMHGGPSQVDTFDPKPELTKRHGQPFPGDKPRVTFAQTGNLLRSPFEFRRYGESGLEVSELFSHVGAHADDLCVVRSICGSNPAHGGACMMLQTGTPNFVRPSMGAWIGYGLGTENENLPGFVTIDPRGHCGHRNWSAAFLPARFQGTPLRGGRFDDIGDIADAKRRAMQRSQLDLLDDLNGRDLERAGADSELEARIASFELAFRMQMEAPELVDLSQESDATRRLYGIDEKGTESFGRQCLLARRLAERGVRFVQVSHGYWDQHGDLAEQHRALAREVDKPIAGLLADLKQRGLLEDTLVIWGGEFGRTPCAQGDVNSPKAGRDHNPHGYSMWFAGAGVRAGTTYGETDDFGWYAVRDEVHLHDFHATLLHLLGIDHERLTYRHLGRDFRLTDVFGEVVDGVLA